MDPALESYFEPNTMLLVCDNRPRNSILSGPKSDVVATSLVAYRVHENKGATALRSTGAIRTSLLPCNESSLTDFPTNHRFI